MQMISRDDWSCAIRRRCGPGTAERTGEIFVYILGTHAGSRVAEPRQYIGLRVLFCWFLLNTARSTGVRSSVR